MRACSKYMRVDFPLAGVPRTSRLISHLAKERLPTHLYEVAFVE
jgi:hypothetical protein